MHHTTSTSAICSAISKQVNNNNYKKYAQKEAGLLNLSHSPTLTATHNSDCQTPSGQIPEDEPQQEIDGYGAKDFEKRKVLRQEWKNRNPTA